MIWKVASSSLINKPSPSPTLHKFAFEVDELATGERSNDDNNYFLVSNLSRRWYGGGKEQVGEMRIRR